MQERMFWKVCIAWAILLGAFFAFRQIPTDPLAATTAAVASLPDPGASLDLPASLTTREEYRIPALASSQWTLFLVTWTGCARCKRELTSVYPNLLQAANETGFATRMIVVPASRVEDSWFLERTPPDVHVVVDTSRSIVSALRARVTPSVILVNPRGSVTAVFSPSREWPVTRRMLEQISSLAEATFRTTAR